MVANVQKECATLEQEPHVSRLVQRSDAVPAAPVAVPTVQTKPMSGYRVALPELELQVAIASLMAVSAAMTLPQVLMGGKSWGWCNMNSFSAQSGIPASLVAQSLRWSEMAGYIERRVTRPCYNSMRLHIHATREGIEAVDAALSALNVIRSRW
jgi:hypothetical protein